VHNSLPCLPALVESACTPFFWTGELRNCGLNAGLDRELVLLLRDDKTTKKITTLQVSSTVLQI
jgi:hypothetical protein